MSVLAVYHVVAIGLLAGLGFQLVANRHRLRRLAPGSPQVVVPNVSVLIPARNEACRIANCIRGWMGQAYPDIKVLVYDDESTDGTAERAAAAGSGRLQVIPGSPLPPGWRGKPHACHLLRSRAAGEVLVFADADVSAAPETLAAATAMLSETGADAVSALPLHTGRGLLLRALASMQNWSALTFLPLWLTAASRHTTFTALNGQFLVIRASVYDDVGGFAAVHGSLAEDTALGRLLVTRGHRVELVDGSSLLRCVPYQDLRQAWSANVRNLVPIFFGSAALLAASLVALAALYLLPWLLLAVAVGGWGQGWPATVLPGFEIVLGLTARRLGDAFFGYPWRITLLHPVAIAGMVAMGFGSIIRHRIGHVVAWRGRCYRLGDEAADLRT